MYLKPSFIIFSSCYLLLSACGSSKKAVKTQNLMPGTWQATTINIDGDSKDWPSPYPNYDSKGKVGYATSNDAKFLYITVESGDELTQLKILKAGMTISIDTSGGKNPGFSIKYPLENENTEIEIPRPDNGSKDASMHAAKQLTQNIRKAIEVTNQYSLQGFTGCDGGYMVPQVPPCGIKVRMRLDEYKEIVWEAAIPVKLLYGKEKLTAEDAGRPISVCYAVNGVKKPKSEGSDNVNNNMGADMNGTPGTQHNSAQRGTGGGRRPGIDNPMEHLYTGTKTWKQFRLAAEPK